MNKFIQGAGGKSGGGSRTPVEAPNSLRSASFARIIDVVSEGEIKDLVDGHKSIYFDDTPLMNADGSYNFKDVAVEMRTGTIGQARLTNTDGVESTQTISTALKYNQPVVRSIIAAETDLARVGIAVGQLSKQNTENGDIKGTSVQHKIEYRANGGAWITVKTDTITGKTMSGYERQVTFKLSGSAPWDVRVTRLTADSTSSALANASNWTTLTGVITDKFRYPATALVGIQINAEQFNNIPTRSYDVRGIKVKVPSNYNPLTRAYTGAWDGSFKVDWTDNPAWCLYDLLTNKRYGLGSRIDAGMLDKWKFYQIAQYCDQLVPNGKGGTEPRFTCNLYLQSRVEAYKFIQDMASIFRGITYWATGAIIVNQDAPAPVRYQFNNTNVEVGIFDRAGSNVQTRHNVALVSWNDPSNGYKQSIEYVEDFAAIQKMGYVSETEVSAFGCTSQGMARRYGEWLLYVEQNESEIISFTTGQEGVIPLPGDVIQVSDAFHTGKRVGGRVLSGSTKTSIKLDLQVTLLSGKKYQLHVIDADGGFQTGAVTNAAGTASTVTVTGITKPLAENTTWILSSDDLKPELFRVVGADEIEAGKYRVSCLSYNPSKYAYVERQQTLQTPQTTNLGSMQPDVANVVVTEQTNYDKNDIPISRLLVTWKPVNAVSTAFFVEYRTADGQWQRTTTTTQYSAEIPLLSDATSYEIRVAAGNRLLGAWANNPQTITYTPEAYSVPNITNLVAATAWSTGQDVTIKWDVVNAKAYEVQVLEGATVRRTIKATESTCTYTAQDYKADGCNTRSLTFKVRAISSNGRTGAWSQVVATNVQIGALQGIKVTAGVTQAFFEYAKPADADFAGLCIWVDTTANFTPTDANKVFDGNDAVITLSKLGNGLPLVGKQTYYLRAAGYDTFGKDALTISASTAFSIYSVTSQVQALQKSQLAADLQAPIDLITASSATAGSVNARIDAETANRVAALSAESTNRANAITAEAQARQAADTTEKNERVAGDSAANSRIDTLKTSFDNNSAAVQNQLSTLSAADSANAQAIQTVAAQLQTITTHEALSFDANSNVADWVRFSGSGESSLVAESSARGGYVWRAGNNNGNDQVFGVHKNLLKVSDALIKVTARWRRVSGAGGVYIGLAGVAADGVTWVNSAGENTFSSQHYVVSNAKPTLGEWQTTVGYLRKGGSGNALSATTPRSLHAQVEYVRPVFLGNYSSVAGEVDLDYFDFEVVSASTLALVDEVKQSSVAGDTANASAILALQTTVANNKTSTDAAITSLSQTSNSADTALGQRIDSVTATVTQNKNTTDAAITGANTVRATADTALGQRIDAVIATANTDRTNANAAITAEQTARANADSALGTRVDTLTATVNSNNTSQAAAVQNEAAARVAADSANAQAIKTLSAQMLAIRREKTFSFSSGSILADFVNYSGSAELSLIADTGARGGAVLHAGNNSGNDQFCGIHKDNFRVDDDLIKIVARWRRVSGAGGVYIGLAGVLPDGVTLIDERGYLGSFSNQMYVVSNAKPALGKWQTTTAYFKKGGAGNGSAYSVPYKMIDAAAFVRPLVLFNYTDSAGECELDYFTIEAVASSSFAYVDETKQVLSAVDAAQASQINTLQTQANNNTASIQQSNTVVDGLRAQSVLILDVNGYVSGVGTYNDGKKSAFLVNADNFAVGAAGKSTTMPFVVDTVNNKVGINGDAIVQGTLSASKVLIGDASNLVLDPFGADLRVWGKGASPVVLEQWISSTASDPITSGIKTYTRAGAFNEFMNNPKGAYTVPRAEFGAFTVTAGESYYVKCWVYKNAGDTPVRAHLGLRLSNGLDNTGAYPRINIDFTRAESGWKLIEGIVTIPNLVNGYPPNFALMHGGVWNACTLNGVGVIFGGMVIRRANGGELTVAGSVKTHHLAADSVTADKLSVTDLSAVSSNLGNVNIVKGQGSDPYGWIRTNEKWWADANNGTVIARNNSNGDTFFDSKAGNNRIWMSSWNDCGIEFPGIRMTNGGLTINQLDVIDTQNILDGAVSNTVSGVYDLNTNRITSRTNFFTVAFNARKDGVGVFAVELVNDVSSTSVSRSEIFFNNKSIAAISGAGSIKQTLVLPVIQGENRFNFFVEASSSRSAMVSGLWLYK